ncbi:hypothetical protein PSP6_320040 [Paraburkholderia tropica]|nr:hypothetical protein PSP6_320040 [Paraburkholderia tropica]
MISRKQKSPQTGVMRRKFGGYVAFHMSRGNAAAEVRVERIDVTPQSERM